MEYFILNGVNSNTITGLMVKKLPPLMLAKKDIDSIKIDGRNGNLHIDNGTYEVTTRTIECAITDLTQMDSIKAFLAPIGTVTFSSEPNVRYNYVIVNQIPFDKYLTVLRDFPVQLELSPIAESTTETTVTKTTFPATFVVAGTIGAKPILEIKGTGEATITLNGTSFVLEDCTSTAYIVDCDLQNVTKNSLNVNDEYVGSFPSLIVGTNTLSCVGTISEIKVKYRASYL